jgi:hypothetical protein
MAGFGISDVDLQVIFPDNVTLKWFILLKFTAQILNTCVVVDGIHIMYCYKNAIGFILANLYTSVGLVSYNVLLNITVDV